MSPLSAGQPLLQLARWGLYPVVLLVTFTLNQMFRLLGASPWLAAYAAVVIGCLWLISRLERWFPHSQRWFASAPERRTDLTFLIVVSTLLPMALALGVAALTSRVVPSWLPWSANLWPRMLNPWAQVLLILVLADIPRYWLHRSFHGSPSLWRLHAIHHAVRKLNVWNSSRFHPLETSLQFLCDTAPFILLGISAEVLSLYFVLHATKGFLQHSNLDVRLGLVNRLISGPELHRLHHSRNPSQSHSNFGNKLSIWDQLWGTYLDPAHQHVSALGIAEDQGDGQFLRQLLQPFRQRQPPQSETPEAPTTP